MFDRNMPFLFYWKFLNPWVRSEYEWKYTDFVNGRGVLQLVQKLKVVNAEECLLNSFETGKIRSYNSHQLIITTITKIQQILD